jgi:hypothetical protein
VGVAGAEKAKGSRDVRVETGECPEKIPVITTAVRTTNLKKK